MAKTVCWKPKRPYRAHAPKSSEQRQKVVKTNRGGRHLFTSSGENGQEDAPEGRRARISDSWLAPTNLLMECELVWGGYIDLNIKGKPLPQVGLNKIEREVSDFHSHWMNSPPKTSSLKYWA